jgi:hypothetical protein
MAAVDVSPWPSMFKRCQMRRIGRASSSPPASKREAVRYVPSFSLPSASNCSASLSLGAWQERVTQTHRGASAEPIGRSRIPDASCNPPERGRRTL